MHGKRCLTLEVVLCLQSVLAFGLLLRLQHLLALGLLFVLLLVERQFFGLLLGLQLFRLRNFPGLLGALGLFKRLPAFGLLQLFSGELPVFLNALLFLALQRNVGVGGLRRHGRGRDLRRRQRGRASWRWRWRGFGARRFRCLARYRRPQLGFGGDRRGIAFPAHGPGQRHQQQRVHDDRQDQRPDQPGARGWGEFKTIGCGVHVQRLVVQRIPSSQAEPTGPPVARRRAAACP